MIVWRNCFFSNERFIEEAISLKEICPFCCLALLVEECLSLALSPLGSFLKSVYSLALRPILATLFALKNIRPRISVHTKTSSLIHEKSASRLLCQQSSKETSITNVCKWFKYQFFACELQDVIASFDVCTLTGVYRRWSVCEHRIIALSSYCTLSQG